MRGRARNDHDQRGTKASRPRTEEPGNCARRVHISCRGSIGAQLVTRVPDVTRLIDRLVNAGLLERFRTEEDRRVVKVRLTSDGIDLVETVHEPLLRHNRELFASMPTIQLEQLARGLKRAQTCLSEAENQEEHK